MKWKLFLLFFIGSIPLLTQKHPGAYLPFTTMEAETMHTNAVVLNNNANPDIT